MITTLLYSKDRQAKAKVLGMLKSWASLTLDIETKGDIKDMFSLEIIMMQLGNDQDQIVIDCREFDAKEFINIIKDKKIIGHNLKFDVQVVYLNTGIMLKDLWDTMLAAQVLECGDPKGKYSLQETSRRYVDEFAYSKQTNLFLPVVTKEVRKTFMDWEGPFLEEQIVYGALDVYYTYRLYSVLVPLLEKEELILTAEDEFEFLHVVMEMEREGMPFNQEKWSLIAEHSEDETYRLLEILTKIAAINWNSPKQVIGVFNKFGINTKIIDKETGTLKDSVNVNVLVKQKQNHEVLQTYLDYKQAKKLESAYGHKFLRFVNPRSGRIHTSIRQILETGRTASTDPNLQQVPRLKHFRECFEAVDGNVLVIADYANQELRVLADKANEPSMLDAFRHGRDIHLETARIAFEDPTLTKDSVERQMAKSMNFLMAYGGGAAKLADAFGLSISKAKSLIAKYYKNFSSLAEYFFNVGEEAKERGYILIDDVIGRKSFIEGYKDFVRDGEHLDKFNYDAHPYVEKRYRMVSGKIQRDAQNRPIQGTSANISKRAGVLLQKEREKQGYTLRFCFSSMMNGC